MEYKEDDYLQLSGIEHFLFCRRQWALIHIEKQWQENELTTDGNIFHKRVHDHDQSELRGDVLTIRGMSIKSMTLGISGSCDVVEFIHDENGIELTGRSGKWKVCPVEYKRGNYDISEADSAQLCAEAMCLEEMLCCRIEYGYLFWGEIRRRERVEFTEALRKTVTDAFKEMHEYYDKGYTPRVKTRKGCLKCSLRDICLPQLTKKVSVRTYIKRRLEDES
jgi:CRISPR-associated exonuclease Cas4